MVIRYLQKKRAQLAALRRVVNAASEWHDADADCRVQQYSYASMERADNADVELRDAVVAARDLGINLDR